MTQKHVFEVTIKHLAAVMATFIEKYFQMAGQTKLDFSRNGARQKGIVVLGEQKNRCLQSSDGWLV